MPKSRPRPPSLMAYMSEPTRNAYQMGARANTERELREEGAQFVDIGGEKYRVTGERVCAYPGCGKKFPITSLTKARRFCGEECSRKSVLDRKKADYLKWKAAQAAN